MIASYFDILDETTRDLVNEIESQVGTDIDIEVDESRKKNLACEVDIDCIKIIIPSPEHFPIESVYHELLHIRRFCIDKVPKIAANDSCSSWSPKLIDLLAMLDNDIEHFIIVPEECEKYTSRKNYWTSRIITLVKNIGESGLSSNDVKRKALLWWAFSKHAFKVGDSVQASTSLIKDLSLEEKAASFLDEIENFISNKGKLVRVFFDYLGLSPEIGCLEYIDCNNKRSHEESIPEIHY